MTLNEAAAAFVKKNEIDIKKRLHVQSFDAVKATKVVINFANKYMVPKGLKNLNSPGIKADIIGAIWGEIATKKERDRAAKVGEEKGKALGRGLVAIIKAHLDRRTYTDPSMNTFAAKVQRHLGNRVK